MDAILNLLHGKKTYIAGACGILVTGLWIFGMIDVETATKALVALGFGGLISLRAGVTKSGPTA